MADNALAQHPPAIKVGGRRLSVSRPKPRTSTAPADILVPGQTAEETDYPRPAPPHDLMNNEEPPKNEKRHIHRNHDHEKKMMEVAYKKMEATQPTRDSLGGKNGFGGAGRLVQPSAKGLAT